MRNLVTVTPIHFDMDRDAWTILKMILSGHVVSSACAWVECLMCLCHSENAVFCCIYLYAGSSQGKG